MCLLAFGASSPDWSGNIQYYTSGQYTYNLDIANNSELVICGSNESGGETINFGEDKDLPTMTIFGLTMKKCD